jgi:uncharacterized protein
MLMIKAGQRLAYGLSDVRVSSMLRGRGNYDRTLGTSNPEAPMSLTMYQASVPVFVQYLNALDGLLDKAKAMCAAKKIDETVLTGMRLAPDMFPLARQVQIACDFAKGASARLAGADVPAWDDNEKSIDELRARIRKTVDFIQGFKVAQIAASEERDIKLKIRGNDVTFKGQPYLTNFAMGHFFFHATTAYNILRHNGVEVGKGDFIGQVPGMK